MNVAAEASVALAQRLAPAVGAGEIAEIAADLSALSRAAEVLAKLRDRT